MIEIIMAKKQHGTLIAPLFNDYRVFYGQRTDITAALDYLEERFDHGETVIFLAFDKHEPIGFTQLYKTFSSVSLQPFFILNDLFVKPGVRKKGVGKALLEKAKSYCIQLKYKGLALETAIDNPAQKLYETLGWKKDPKVYHYFWAAPME
ncbi:MAG: GNAT family N-acetyltransferase [Bacteroidota bacterium]